MSKITKELLKRLFPHTPASKRDRFVEPFNVILPKYGITTKKRFAAFIANVGIESDRLKTLREYGEDAYFKKYEGRTTLGNVRKGDGLKYLGRSVLQTTGRYNYWRVVITYLRVLTGKNWDNPLAHSDFDAYLKTAEYDRLLKEADKYSVNFLAHPEMLETFPHGVEAAGIFVKDNDLNKYADAGKFFEYAGIINRGSPRKKALHYNERQALYNIAMAHIPDNFSLEKAQNIVDTVIEAEILPTPEVVEVTHTEVEKTEEGSVSQTVETKNEQDVNTPVDVKEGEKYQGVGFIATLKKDFLAVGGGNIGFEAFNQFLQQVAGVPEWLAGLLIWIGGILLVLGVLWIVGRFVHYAWFRWDQRDKRRLEAEINADPTKRDINWVK